LLYVAIEQNSGLFLYYFGGVVEVLNYDM